MQRDQMGRRRVSVVGIRAIRRSDTRYEARALPSHGGSGGRFRVDVRNLEWDVAAIL